MGRCRAAARFHPLDCGAHRARTWASALLVEEHIRSAGSPVSAETKSSIPYVAPFAVLMALLAARDFLPLLPVYGYAVRTVAVALVLVAVSRPAIRLRPARALESAAAGILVFAIWVLPDLLAPAWRQHWLFANAVVGRASSSVSPAGNSDAVFLISRLAGSVLLVPIVEELFWRGFLMRWLAGHPFWSVPLGKYTRFSFWATAILFASEHGPYWDVGLLAGITYNWWMLRTRSLADCILAHAVTNGCLAAYVLASGRWEYWV